MTLEELKQQFSADIDLDKFLIDGKVFALNNQFHQATLVSLETEDLSKGTIRFIGELPWKVSYSYLTSSKIRNFILGRGWKPVFEVYWQCAGPVQFSRSRFKELIIEKLYQKLN